VNDAFSAIVNPKGDLYKTQHLVGAQSIALCESLSFPGGAMLRAPLTDSFCRDHSQVDFILVRPPGQPVHPPATEGQR